MIDIEKFIRDGKSEEEILKALQADIEKANLKIEKEREAEKIAALKKEQLDEAKAKATAALQAVYDLTGGKITVYILNGKVRVLVDEKLNSRGKNASFDHDYRGTCDDIWDDLLNILR